MRAHPAYRRTLPLLLCLAVAAACDDSTDPQNSGDPPDTVPEAAVRMEAQPIDEATTTQSLIDDRRRLLIDDETEWADFWAEFNGAVTPMPPLPEVDFSTHMIVAATMGQQSSGGFSIEVAEVYEADGTLYPIIVEVSPGPSCVVTSVISAPAVAVRVERAGTDASFVEESEVSSC